MICPVCDNYMIVEWDETEGGRYWYCPCCHLTKEMLYE